MATEHKAFDKARMSRFWGKVKTYVANAISGLYTKPSGGIPKSDLSNEVQTSLGKADTALQSFTESDPTVPSWAKQSSKPTYTAQEVGALPSSTPIPTKTSDLTNDSGFLTQHQSLKTIGGNAITGSGNIPWPTYTANDTGALPNTTTLADLEDATHKTVTPTEKETWNGKQDAINDLADIRSGAAKGDTALQEHQTLKTINYNSIVGSGNIEISRADEIRGRIFPPKAKGIIYGNTLAFQYNESEIFASTTTASIADNKTISTLDFDPFGNIFSVINGVVDGAEINGSSLAFQRLIDFRNCFNIVATPLVKGRCVYIKCEPLVDGSNNRTGRTRFATGNPIVQDIPTTADGYVYLFLGWAASTTHLFLCSNHPIYEYRNGGIKLWIGD